MTNTMLYKRIIRVAVVTAALTGIGIGAAPSASARYYGPPDRDPKVITWCHVSPKSYMCDPRN